MNNNYKQDSDTSKKSEVNDRSGCSMEQNLIPEGTDCWALSEVENESFTFLWTLRNYSRFVRRDKEEILSPIFKCPAKLNLHWQIEISPKWKVEETGKFSVYLLLVHPPGESTATAFRPGGSSDSEEDGDGFVGNRCVRALFKFSLVGSDGEFREHYDGEPSEEYAFYYGHSWGYKNFLTSEDLFDGNKKLVENDTLRIHCRIVLPGDWKHSNGVSVFTDTENVKKRRSLEKLGQEMKSMLFEPKFSDFTILTKGESILVHKAVLAARSRVFAAMFNSEMKETTQNSLAIPDFEVDVIKGMIEYMYSGETSTVKERAFDLIKIAEKYELLGLKEECEEVIAAHLTPENAGYALVISKYYNASKLQTEVLAFIRRNKEVLLKTDAFVQDAKAHAEMFIDLYITP